MCKENEERWTKGGTGRGEVGGGWKESSWGGSDDIGRAAGANNNSRGRSNDGSQDAVSSIVTSMSAAGWGVPACPVVAPMRCGPSDCVQARAGGRGRELDWTATDGMGWDWCCVAPRNQTESTLSSNLKQPDALCHLRLQARQGSDERPSAHHRRQHCVVPPVRGWPPRVAAVRRVMSREATSAVVDGNTGDVQMQMQGAAVDAASSLLQPSASAAAAERSRTPVNAIPRPPRL